MCGSSWCAIATSNATADAATRRHSVGAAGPRRVEVAEVDRALDHQVAAAAGRELALPRADAHAARVADIAHRTAVVRPDARLLEPVEVEVGDAARELDRLAPASTPGWRRRRGRSRSPAASRAVRNRAASSSGVRPPTLNFMPGEPLLAEPRHLRGDVLVAVVAADRDHRERCRGSRPRAGRAAGRAPCRLRPRGRRRCRRSRRARAAGRGGCRRSRAGRAPSSRSMRKPSSPISRGAISSRTISSISSSPASSSPAYASPTIPSSVWIRVTIVERCVIL